MRKALVMFIVVLAAAVLPVVAQTAQQPPATQPEVAPESQASSRKVILDRNEYDAYITALRAKDPATKAFLMEDFVKQYPKTVMRAEALEEALAGYQAAGNGAKVEEIAAVLLKENPLHVQARAVVVSFARARVTDPETAAVLKAEAEKGLEALAAWRKRPEVADADFALMQNSLSAIFNGALGFAALQEKNYTAARDYYMKAVQINPNSLEDVYQLGVACLEMNPMDLNGFWYVAKASYLAGPEGKSGILGYAKPKYRAFHGNTEGWDEIVAAAATQLAPPPEIAQIKPAPTECDMAVEAVKNNDPANLSIGDWEFILSKRDCTPANKEAADKVWQAIQRLQKDGKQKLELQVEVIASDKHTIDAAADEFYQKENKADLHVVMAQAMIKPPPVGGTIIVVGLLTDYTPKPFMFTMEKGEWRKVRK